jgi:hypothetical protein
LGDPDRAMTEGAADSMRPLAGALNPATLDPAKFDPLRPETVVNAASPSKGELPGKSPCWRIERAFQNMTGRLPGEGDVWP